MATSPNVVSFVPVVNAYSKIVNARYTNSKSNIVDLATRLNDTVANLQPSARTNWTRGLSKARREFKKRFPNVTDFSNRVTFPLCQAIELPMAQICIDITTQRELILQWILKITTEFRPYQAQPIQVYQTPDGRWAAWDGQHTAIALYIIATDFMGLNPAGLMIPCNIYSMSNRGQLRDVFIRNNLSTGKLKGKTSLDLIDIVMQMIYGVKIDNVTEPEWESMARKQDVLAAAGLYLTAEKFGDHTLPGAITRIEEICDYSEEVVRQFAVYGEYVVSLLQRPINTKELPLVIEFLNMCESNQIVYTDNEIRDLAEHLIQLFGADFDADGPFWEKLHQAHLNAHHTAYKAQNLPKHLWPEDPKNLKNLPYGMTFLWHQLRKTWAAPKGKNFKFPKGSYNVFVPANGDLW